MFFFYFSSKKFLYFSDNFFKNFDNKKYSSFFQFDLFFIMLLGNWK